MGAFFSQIGYKADQRVEGGACVLGSAWREHRRRQHRAGRAAIRGDRPAAEARRTGRRGRARGAAEAPEDWARARRRFPTAKALTLTGDRDPREISPTG